MEFWEAQLVKDVYLTTLPWGYIFNTWQKTDTFEGILLKVLDENYFKILTKGDRYHPPENVCSVYMKQDPCFEVDASYALTFHKLMRQGEPEDANSGVLLGWVKTYVRTL